MTRTLGFRIAAVLGAVVAVVAGLVAVVVAATGALVVTGAIAQPDAVHLVPGTHLADVSYQPSWSARLDAPVCRSVDLSEQQTVRDCFGFSLHHGDSGFATGSVPSGTDVRPTSVRLAGQVLLAPPRGWNPLIASLYGMAALGWVVLAVVLALLTRVLRAAAQGEPFDLRSVRALRAMGWLVIGWQVAQPLLWLVLSPKAWDYSEASVGGGPQFRLGPMETPVSMPLLCLGGLLVLLAAVFRHGERMADEQAMTV